jgi:hypothetical protein
VKRSSLSLPEVLDDAFAVAVRVASPWMGVLWLTALPVRLLQIHFATRVSDLGAEASQYGAHLLDLASLTGLAFLLSLWGRAVFVRATGLALRCLESPGWEALRLAPAAGLSYVYAALVLEVLFFALGWTLLGLPLFILLAGLAAATFPLNDRPSLLRPLREIARHTTPLLVLLGLLFVFGVALLIAALNLYFVFRLGLWLAGGVPGLDLTPWSGLLDLSSSRFRWVLLAGATLAVEPYWLAALVVHVHKVRSRESGEDLRLAFARLRREAA